LIMPKSFDWAISILEIAKKAISKQMIFFILNFMLNGRINCND
jgi:hypothetical protein